MITEYEEFLQNGKKIHDTYCSDNDNHPIMLPRAPEQKYIDQISPDQDQPGCSFERDRRQQSNYEAEVKVYRALENLDENLIVLHNFEFTHYQYHLGDPSHSIENCDRARARGADKISPAHVKKKQKLMTCGEKADNTEGECDFVVIGPNYFVIIEVKNMSDMGAHQQGLADEKKKAEDPFQKSLDKREKMVTIIERFSKDLTVIQFTALPNFP